MIILSEEERNQIESVKKMTAKQRYNYIMEQMKNFDQEKQKEIEKEKEKCQVRFR